MNAHLSERAHAPCLVLGAGGRVGRLLRGAWSGATDRAPVLFHSRKPEAGIDIVAPFGAKLAARVKGPVSAVLVLSGATSGSEQDLSANSRRALVGLEIAKALKVSQVILCSSAAVYRASPDHPPFDEGATAETVTDRLYGQAKLAMEAAAMDWVRQFGGELEVTCLRMANVIGADQLARAVRRASLDAPLRLDRFADGRSPRRSYLSPETLAGVVVAIASRAPRPGFRVYNLADTGPAVSMSEILLALETFGHRVPWTWQAAPAEAIPELTLDTARLRAALAGCPALACPSSGSELVAAWIRASGGAL